MHAIAQGKERPVLWSPGSPIWPARLNEVWQTQTGSSLVDLQDPNGYRVFLRSPLLFLTTRKKAGFLRKELGSPHPWTALRKLSLGETRVPWGRFRFSHADPLTSSSGMLTLGLAMLEYAQSHPKSGSLEQIADSPDFLREMQRLEKSLVYDADAEKGTTALTKAFIADPNRYDLITAYESAALEAAGSNSELAVIYPAPTAVSEHAVSLLRGGWVTAEQREGALAFIQFLGEPGSIEAGLKYHFRPVQAAGGASLDGELARLQAQGFEQRFASVDLPSYRALNAAAYQWRIHVVHKDPGKPSL
jgi:hypothetical protein